MSRLAPALARLRRIRDELGEQETDPQALEDIRAANDELAPFRASATRSMLADTETQA